MGVTYKITDGCAVITFDNPPLNVFGQDMRSGLSAAIDKAVKDKAERLILTGAGRCFVAGSDAKEFDGPALAPHLNNILKRLADLTIPTVAAINGAALGGGLEIALACRYRICVPDAVLGLPEVTLGILPGAGGTQRLPRLVGVAVAADMIGRGKRITAKAAQDIGLIDAIADDPVAAAKALDNEILHSAVVPDHRDRPKADVSGVEAAHGMANKTMSGQNAPHAAIELVAASGTLSLDAALMLERKTFLNLRTSDQARALRQLFFAERAAQSLGKRFPSDKKTVETAIVVGGGTMGSAIAYAFLMAGIAVTLVEIDEAASVRAQNNINGLISKGVRRGVLNAAAADRVRGLISFASGYDNLPPVDLAIEAAFEDMSVKKAILARLQDALPDTTVLATNTSYLDVNALAQDVRSPERFLGLHFFAPAHLMKLLEVVKNDQTSEATLGLSLRLAKQLGKIPVLAGVCDGFIGNRILKRYRQAADVLLIEGAKPEDIDSAMRDFGMAMGPYEAQDMSGLDIAYANRQRHNLKTRTDMRYIPIADHLVEDLGRLGRKTSAGWYDYGSDGRATPSADVAKCINEATEAAGLRAIVRSKDDIAKTLFLAMVAEAFDILGDGIAERPSDIDLVLVHGYGFPRWRGGLMHDAGKRPLKDILRDIEDHATRDPLSWHVPDVLRTLVTEGRDLDSLN
jgi:3-hydroxyacyl-CoA dehydrogenase